jgi:hypothetical protein
MDKRKKVMTNGFMSCAIIRDVPDSVLRPCVTVKMNVLAVVTKDTLFLGLCCG